MNLTKSITTLAIVSALTFSQSTFVHAADAKAKPESPSSWLSLTAKELKAVERYATEYKDYIYKVPTELTFVTETIKRVEKQGFTKLTEQSELKPGARFYDVNRDRTIALMVIGKKSLEQGTRIVGAHIDSPRLELKGRPLFEKENFAMFQTYIHGGIKTYQWVNIPLALVGRVDKKDGTRVNISVGFDDNDPIFLVTDLAPHVDSPNRKRTSRDVIGKEELDIIIAAKPELDKKIKDQVSSYLKSTYDISVEDLVSAELALVPATKPRDVGFDRSMIAAYGQDDKASSIAAVKALTEQKTPEYTAIAYLVDNEEVGNINNTGASSTYLVDLISSLLYNQKGDSYNDYQLRQVLRNTKVISADVNPGVNPTWSNVWELGNAPRLGNGVNLKLYGGGFNANSEYMAWTRNYLDNADIKWQTSTYKGKASGGTIGSDLSKDNMEVIDFGIPILSIHSPYAVGSKVDLYSLYKAMSAFYQEK
ncbi:aminopeptidase 1 [Colwellia sp. MB02u-18]|uniref:aminopeptidase 1 n=1 Tax=unclassified Colwellia TaxID=196834 RepID=UPI0015F76FF9|nr:MULTISPECIES: aminopeptidase 1 [unclassified Colwellia]MBA6224248.1 aminopeptidase 1 [Colwellia sp. MB3u-45]MBA6268377.1 aminopeptidase 1 [Colwellia sp. MB3u-43]MBA6322670.1 aminopeptidase 1 [Colwellia sp. MB02u-19]MBA6323579.1 aminopeptidase 1 [Colwellia sp. MB02u-18]MBA6332813.1 aminopeptidase 1 [Colwellia sp. MB02u-12]